MSGNPTIIALPGQIHPEVKESFGHPLPKKYDNLLHLFTSMEKVVSIAHGRNMKITFESVAKNVMKNTKMTFTESHLAQIIGIYEKSYKMRWEKRRQPVGKALGTSAGFDLILTPNLYDDLHPFYDYDTSNVENSSDVDKTRSPAKPKSPTKPIRASPFTTKPAKSAAKPAKEPSKELSTQTETSKKVVVDDEASRILSRTNLAPVHKSPTKQSQPKNVDESSPSKRMADQPLHLQSSPPKTPKTPNTPMRNLTFKDSTIKIEPDFQLPPLKSSANNNEEKSSLIEKTNLVSPIKLISPIKKRNERDFIRKSPMKAPVVPLPRPAQLDPAPKMEGWRRTARKMIFRHFLVLKVKEAHNAFLTTMKITLSPSKLLHSEFDIDSVEDLPTGKIPAMPESSTPLRSAYDYFKSVKPEEPKLLNENLLKSPPPSAKIPPISTSKSSAGQMAKTPKVSLLERLRAREAAKKSIDTEKISKLQKQYNMLELLRKSMVEVICGHFTLEKVRSMNLRKLMTLVFLVCGKLDKETFMEHIDVLCEVAPGFCRKETLRNEAYLKISEVRVDKIQNCVDEALEKTKRELRLQNA